MNADKLIHDATASTKGTIYQLCVAVQKCYEMVAGQKVLIENRGDITIPDSQQVETKHYSDDLNDNHPNIWKTLRNWMQDDFYPKPYTSLILYTTQQFGERATISKWNDAPSQERLEILKAIHRQTEERKSDRQNKASDAKTKIPDVLLLQRFVLDLSRRDKLKQVIERFVIEACSSTLPELHTVIKQQYIKGILDGKKDDFLDALIGFITQAQATGEQRWEITYDRFDRKVGTLIALYNRETRVFPRKHFDSSKLPYDHQVDAHRDHAFVQKIQDIEYHSTIPKAVKDYLGAVQTINDEFKNYEVPPSRTENYANELVDIFKTRYRVASRKCMHIIADSQNFFDEVTVEEPREFEGFDRPPMAFRNGLLHTQLNDDVKLQWRLVNK